VISLLISYLKVADSVDKLIKRMRGNPKDVSFSDLCKVCQYYFGKPRHNSSSHCINKTPCQGDPRINLQNDRGKAKVYQVGQVLKAIDKLGRQNDSKNNKSN
jgi:hypothetical protein